MMAQFFVVVFNSEICVKYVSKITSNTLQNLCVFSSKHANSPYQVWRSVEQWTRWWQIVVVYNFPVIFRIFIILLCNTFRVIMVKDITFICSSQNTKQWQELEAKAEQDNWHHLTSSAFLWSFTPSQTLGYFSGGKEVFGWPKCKKYFLRHIFELNGL